MPSEPGQIGWVTALSDSEAMYLLPAVLCELDTMIWGGLMNIAVL